MALKDALGDRMKSYEDVTRYKLCNKSYILARIDGNAFHTYTKGLKRPFDEDLIADMDSTAIYLCEEIQNVKFAFVQSDEISLFIHEEGQDTQPWFANNIQKMASISAAKATSEFNRRRLMRFCLDQKNEGWLDHDDIEKFKMGEFDARFWTVPSAIEVYNYFLWRQRDAEKNSISSAAQSVYSHKELENMNGLDKQEMLFQKGINWNDYPAGQKRGRFIERRVYVNGRPVFLWRNENKTKQYFYLDGPTPMEDILVEEKLVPAGFPFVKDGDKVRSGWEVVESPIFSKEPDFILQRVLPDESKDPRNIVKKY